MNVLTETLNNSLKTPIEIWIAAILTIMVYSYLLGDNPLYRLAEHLLVGSVIACGHSRHLQYFDPASGRASSGRELVVSHPARTGLSASREDQALVG
jgi:hypothetical protein